MTQCINIFCSLLSWAGLGAQDQYQLSGMEIGFEVQEDLQRAIEEAGTRRERKIVFLQVLRAFLEHLEESRQEWEYLERVENPSSLTLARFASELARTQKYLSIYQDREGNFSRRLRELRIATVPGNSPLTDEYLRKVIMELRIASRGLRMAELDSSLSLPEEGRIAFLRTLRNFSEILREEESKQEWRYLERVENLSPSTFSSLLETIRRLEGNLSQNLNQEIEFTRRLRELRMAVVPEDSPLTDEYLREVITRVEIFYGPISLPLRGEGRTDFFLALSNFSEFLKEEESKQEWEYLKRVDNLSTLTFAEFLTTIKRLERKLNEDPSREREYTRRLRELRMTVTSEDAPLTNEYLQEVLRELEVADEHEYLREAIREAKILWVVL